MLDLDFFTKGDFPHDQRPDPVTGDYGGGENGDFRNSNHFPKASAHHDIPNECYCSFRYYLFITVMNLYL